MQVFLSIYLNQVRSEDIQHILMKLAQTIQGEVSKPLSRIADVPGTSPRQVFELIKNYIINNYYKQIDFQMLADDFSYSPAYLTKIFKKYSDTTPVRFLTEIRINMAAQLLIKTDMPVSAIGQRVGYPNQFYFSRIFKQHMNMCPLEYRNTMITKGSNNP
ncbi:MAG: helix-turn-helix transcriptional regulator [Acetivibrionales bacterium]